MKIAVSVNVWQIYISCLFCLVVSFAILIDESRMCRLFSVVHEHRTQENRQTAARIKDYK